MRSTVLSACLIAAFALAMSAQSSPPPLSRAERTRFEDTSRYEDVRGFLEALAAQTPRIRVEFFGRSEEGRELPLVVIGDPPAASPEEARRSARPIVLVMANIHAGEVEGKEALLHPGAPADRRRSAGLRRDAVWLFAPIYNADGNERISLENRAEQHGPIGGVGTRENARGLDLNRDFIKLESAEGRALAALLTRWDPACRRRSAHDQRLVSRLSPHLRAVAQPQHRSADSQLCARTPAAGGASGDGGAPPVPHLLLRQLCDRRVAGHGADADRRRGARHTRLADLRSPSTLRHNYIGLRNRIAILSEAYSYLDFAGRVKATEAFVEEIMRFVAANGDAVRTVVSNADNEWQRRAAGSDAAIASRLSALPAQVDILVGAVGTAANPRSGRMMTT